MDEKKDVRVEPLGGHRVSTSRCRYLFAHSESEWHDSNLRAMAYIRRLNHRYYAVSVPLLAVLPRFLLLTLPGDPILLLLSDGTLACSIAT
jgi:hypothetical protein